ncbi:hypothetical protein ANRL1_00714 [Anaerolineae bacterium]|nr:hypothetical protein ANRL1_00714 [Anaerolineae bacterium]
MKKRMTSRFVICIRNKGAEDLELGKVYRVLHDAVAAKDDLMRVIDESGEDYLYPNNYFVAITVPQSAARALWTTRARAVRV